MWQNTNCGGRERGCGVTKAESNLQDTEVFESPESSFCNVVDGIVAQPQHVQPPQVCQASLIQPGQVVVGENPEGKKMQQQLWSIHLVFSKLLCAKQCLPPTGT